MKDYRPGTLLNSTFFAISSYSPKIVSPGGSISMQCEFAKLFKKEENWDRVSLKNMDARDIYARFRVFQELKVKFLVNDSSEPLDAVLTDIKLITTPPEFVGLPSGSLYSKQYGTGRKSNAYKSIVIIDESSSLELRKLRIIKGSKNAIQCTSSDIIQRELLKDMELVNRRHSRLLTQAHFEFIQEADTGEYRKQFLDTNVTSHYFI